MTKENAMQERGYGPLDLQTLNGLQGCHDNKYMTNESLDCAFCILELKKTNKQTNGKLSPEKVNI